MSDVGNNMKMIRERKGMTVSAISIAVGTSQPIIREYESGKREVPDDVIPLIADALYVPITYLLHPELYGDDMPQVPPQGDKPGRKSTTPYNKNYDYTIYNIVHDNLRFSPETSKIYGCYKDYVLKLPPEARTEDHNRFLEIVDELLASSRRRKKV